jgi:hypothetical protein
MPQPQKQSLKQPEKITDTVPDEKSYKLIFEPAPGPIRREDFRPISSLTPDTTFAEAIDIMRHLVSPPLNIVVFWNDLEANADIDRDTPIGIEAPSGVTLRTHLKLILTSLSATADARLTYVVHDGIIKIATEDSLPKLMGTRVYDITDLTAPPANFFDYGGPYMFLQNRYGSGGDYGFGRNYGYGNYSSRYGRGYGYNRGYNSYRGYTPSFGRNYGSSLSFR